MTRCRRLFWIPPPASYRFPAVLAWIPTIFDGLATGACHLCTFYTSATFSSFLRRLAFCQGICNTLSSQPFDGFTGRNRWCIGHFRAWGGGWGWCLCWKGGYGLGGCDVGCMVVLWSKGVFRILSYGAGWPLFKIKEPFFDDMWLSHLKRDWWSSSWTRRVMDIISQRFRTPAERVRASFISDDFLHWA